MPRSNELSFLLEKLMFAEADDNRGAAVDLRRRIRLLRDEVSQFKRGLLKKPYR